MSAEPIRGWQLLGVLVLVQTVLCLGGGVELWLRSDPAEAPFRWEALDEPLPAAPFERDGQRLAPLEGRVIVHFWATWCAPCRVELPSLLEAAERDGVRLIAATDEDWAAVERFFDGEVPTAIARDPGGAARGAFGVSGLPDTFVVRDGRVVARVGGPRSWSGEAGRAFLTGR